MPSCSSIPTAATPTFSPAAGGYTSAQTVTISSATSGAAIYYTTDGTTPTTGSTLYSAPISVAVTETVKALAVKSGYTNSAVGSAAYTIAISGHPGGGQLQRIGSFVLELDQHHSHRRNIRSGSASQQHGGALSFRTA